jgi:hypothetical protein
MLVVPLIPFAMSPLLLPMALATLILMSVALVWYSSV